MLCPTCEAEAPAGARFCYACGGQLTQATSEVAQRAAQNSQTEIREVGATAQEAEKQQRLLGIGSWVFVAMELLFFILMTTIPRESDYYSTNLQTIFLIMGNGVLLLAGFSIGMGILGLMRGAERSRGVCLYGAIAGTIVLGIAMLTVAGVAFSYS